MLCRHDLVRTRPGDIGRLEQPLGSPQLKDFADNLEPVSAVADAADGIVRRFQTEAGDATDLRIFGDEWMLVNMSVWRDSNALTAFMYQGMHRELLARRYEFLERMHELMTTMRWVPGGHRPTIGEAEERLLHVREHGPTQHAFTLRKPFPAPGGVISGGG